MINVLQSFSLGDCKAVFDNKTKTRRYLKVLYATATSLFITLFLVPDTLVN